MGLCVSITSDWMSGIFYTPDTLSGCTDIYPNGDHYLAQLKGWLLQLDDTLDIRDLNNHIAPGSTQDAAYIIKTNYKIFPKGSVHLMCVDCEPSPTKPLLLVSYQGYYFVGPDCESFSYLFTHQPDQVILLNLIAEPSGFRSLASFVYAVNVIRLGLKLTKLGPEVQIKPAKVYHQLPDILQTTIAFIDSFGSFVCDVSQDELNDFAKGRMIYIEFEGLVVNEISDSVGRADYWAPSLKTKTKRNSAPPSPNKLFATYNIENKLTLTIVTANNTFPLLDGVGVGKIINIRFEARLF